MNIRFLKFLVFAILSAFYLLFPTQILASTNVGYTDITGYYPSANNGTSALCTLIEVPDSGTVTSVSTHIQNTQANLFKVAIYTDNGGQPGNLIENTVTQGVPVSNQVNSLTLTNPYHFLGNFWVCTAFNGNVYNYAYTDGSSAALDGFNFGTFPATFIPTWVSNEQNYAVFATVDYDSSVTPTPTSVPMEPFGEGTFTASNYSFDPITHVLSFNASNFNPPRTTGISDINDFAITMYNSAGQFVLDYYNYSVAPCNQGTIFNLTAIFNQEVCYNQYWHADLPTNDAIVYLRIAQGGSGNYHSQPIHADELFTSVPTPTGTPSTGGTFTASNYHFDPVTHVLSFTASNFNPPRSASTDIVNDFAIGLHNGG
ncbi:MAG TPA: hypothetical protein VLF20_01710, partial [Patescibacteria group bacterium]|nr:hypothetical protein [Patescibacteria group bacterium]